MKYLFLVLLLIPCTIFAQDKKVTQLPSDTVVNATDLLYIIDQGTTSKKMTMSKILDVIGDTSDLVRGELADTAAQLRSEIAGGGAWSASGDNVYLTSSNDSVGVGTNAPTEKFQVTGNAYVSGDMRGATLSVGNPRTGVLSISGDNLIFTDNNNAAVSLSSLVAGNSVFSLASTTYYPTISTNNWNFGGVISTTHKLKVTGTQQVTSDLHVGGNLYFYSPTTYISGSSGTITFWPDATNGSGASASSVIFPGTDYEGALQATVFQFYPAKDTFPSIPIEGYTFMKGDAAPYDLLFYDGTEWDTLNNAGGLGSGLEIDLEECATCDTFVVATGSTLAYRVGSVIGTDTTHFNDSIYLDYAVGDYEQWLGLTTTGGVFADSLTDAGFMLTQEILPIEKYIKEIYSNELLWLYKEKGIVKESIGLSKLKPTYQVQALMGGIERAYRYIYVLHEKTEVLENELRKTQAELDDLKESYDFRLKSIEAELNKKTINVKLK